MEQYGWESPTGLQTCIAVPKLLSTSSFLQVPAYEYAGASAVLSDAVVDGLDEIGQEILSYVGKLSNHITADGASRNLKRLRAKHAEHFASPVVVNQVFRLMSYYKFRLAVRRFIYDCFDSALLSEELFTYWSNGCTITIPTPPPLPPPSFSSSSSSSPPSSSPSSSTPSSPRNQNNNNNTNTNNNSSSNVTSSSPPANQTQDD